MKVRLKRAALIDLQALTDYGAAHWGVPRTADFVSGLIDAIEGLADRPRAGRPRDGVSSGMRSIRYRGYIVFFVVEDEAPVVVAVVSERADLAAIDFADRLDEA